MNFDLTEEQRLLEASVREWAAREVAPRIRELDRTHTFDPNIVPQMAALGLLGATVPKEYGGAGMDYIALGLACEELEYVDTSLRVVMSVHLGLNCLTLLAWGTEDQEKRYLVPQAQGHRIAGYGLTEPSAGSDVRGIQTVAVRKGDRYSLTGEKSWISLADVADNFLVFAWTDLKKKRRDPSGISAFIVERAFKGFSSATLKEKWGILAGNTGFFKMDEVEVPAENLVGREGEGFKIAMFALDQGRFTVASGATGLIRACRDASAAYAMQRKTFGVEIGQHQLVKEMIAQMESDYQASRLLWLRSGWLKNTGRRNTRETGLAKWFATVASERAAGDAVEVHGANGYSDEYPVGRFYRNCKGAVIYEGTRRNPQGDAGGLRAWLPCRPSDPLPTAAGARSGRSRQLSVILWRDDPAHRPVSASQGEGENKDGSRYPLGSSGRRFRWLLTLREHLVHQIDLALLTGEYRVGEGERTWVVAVGEHGVRHVQGTLVVHDHQREKEAFGIDARRLEQLLHLRWRRHSRHQRVHRHDA